MPAVNPALALSRVLRDPDWWREQVRGKQALATPQQITRNTLLQAMLDNIQTHEGGTWCVLSARQTMKNEVEAELEALVLYAWAKTGGIYVRTAPTYDQIVTSKMRLRELIADCPVNRAYGQLQQTEGNFTRLTWSRAKIRFVSTHKEASVEGATASIALSNDEFHSVDADHYERRIEPFAGRWNAPQFNWGVAAGGDDKLQEERDRNDELFPERNLIFSADVWAELWPESYGKMWAGMVAKYGRDNPWIRMNYLLQPVTAVASFLGRYSETFLAGDHIREAAPVFPKEYVALIDVAGEEDLDSDEAVEVLMNTGESQLDSTAVIIVEVDNQQVVHGYPHCRVVDLRIWVGNTWKEKREQIFALLNLWQPRVVEVDKIGVGQQLSSEIRREFGARVEGYSATAESIDQDITELYGMLNNGLVKMFRNDQSGDYEEAIRQLNDARRVVRTGKLKIAKKKSSSRIDFPKALTYLPRAIMRMSGASIGTSKRPNRVPQQRRGLDIKSRG